MADAVYFEENPVIRLAWRCFFNILFLFGSYATWLCFVESDKSVNGRSLFDKCLFLNGLYYWTSAIWNCFIYVFMQKHLPGGVLLKRCCKNFWKILRGLFFNKVPGDIYKKDFPRETWRVKKILISKEFFSFTKNTSSENFQIILRKVTLEESFFVRLFVVGLLLYGRRTAPKFFQWIFQLFQGIYSVEQFWRAALKKQIVKKQHISHSGGGIQK